MSEKWVLYIIEPNMPQRVHAKLFGSKGSAADEAMKLSLKNPKWTIKVDRFDESKVDRTNQTYNFEQWRKHVKKKNRSIKVP